MIVIRIELHSAITGEVSELGRAIIANDGTQHGDRGSYDVKIARKGTTDLRRVWEKPLRQARVENYPRLAYSVWELVRRALNAAYQKPDPVEVEEAAS